MLERRIKKASTFFGVHLIESQLVLRKVQFRLGLLRPYLVSPPNPFLTALLGTAGLVWEGPIHCLEWDEYIDDS